METKIMDELLTKANTGSKKSLNKEEQKEYREALLACLKREGITEETIYYIVKGIRFRSPYTYCTWSSELADDEQTNAYEMLVKSKVFAGLDNSMKLRFALTSIANLLANPQGSQTVICDLLYSLVDYSYKKDGKRLSDIGKLFQANFLNELKQNTMLPNLSEYNFTREYLQKLLDLLNEAVEGIVPRGDEEITKRNALRRWIMQNYTEERSSKSNQEQETRADNNEAEKTEQTQKGNMTSDEGADTPSFCGTLAKRLYEIAIKIDIFEQNLQLSTDELKQRDKEIAKLKTKYEKVQHDYVKACDENTALRSQVAESERIQTELKSQVSSLQGRINAQSSVIDIIDEDRDRSMVEFKNQVASSLKKTYDELIRSMEMEMTVDLGLNIRDLLDDVFRKLKKQGIDIEGR